MKTEKETFTFTLAVTVVVPKNDPEIKFPIRLAEEVLSEYCKGGAKTVLEHGKRIKKNIYSPNCVVHMVDKGKRSTAIKSTKE